MDTTKTVVDFNDSPLAVATCVVLNKYLSMVGECVGESVCTVV